MAICKCKLCGKELTGKRAAHAHLMTTHSGEYRASGMKQADFMEYIDNADPRVEKDKFKIKIRHLNTRNHAEAMALRDGYDYIDDD